MPNFMDYMIFVTAEQTFKEKAGEFCRNALPVKNLEILAVNRAKLSDFLPPELRAQLHPGTLATASEETKKGVNYLLSLPEEKLLKLLEQDLPAHVAVLRKYPGYGTQILREIIQLVSS